jgi:hypothetical protein
LIILTKKRRSTALAKKKTEARFVEQMAKKTAKRKALQAAQGVNPVATSVAADRPRRTLLQRTRTERYGHFVSQPSEEEERLEARADLLRSTAVIFPAY